MPASDEVSEPEVTESGSTTLQVGVSALRCPFCHDTVPLEERCACMECLAVHHMACWEEHPRCAACASEQQLIPAKAPRQPRRWKRSRPERMPEDFPLPDPCYAAAAATYLGVTLRELNQLISSGQLSARQDGNDVVFSPEVLRLLRPQVGALRHARAQSARRRWTARKTLDTCALVLAVLGVGLALFDTDRHIVVCLLLVAPYLALYVKDRYSR